MRSIYVSAPPRGYKNLLTIRIFIGFLPFHVDERETQGALPLDPAKGSSTLWTPFFAIQLVTLSGYFRVFMREPPLYFPFAFFHIKYASFGLTIAISPLRRSFCVGIFSTQRQFARKRLMASCRSAVQSCSLVKEK